MVAVTSGTLDTVRELRNTFEKRQAGVAEVFMQLVNILESTKTVVSVTEAGCQTDEVIAVTPKIPLSTLAASATSVHTADFNLSQSSLSDSDWDTSLLLTRNNSNNDTMKSCIVTTPREPSSDHPRLRAVELLRRTEWDSDTQFVGSADRFEPNTEVETVFVVVTLSTVYLADSKAQILDEFGIECISSIQLFKTPGFLAITLDDSRSMLMYLHGDLKSTSHLRFLDVFTELFPQICTSQGDDFSEFVSTPIYRYLDQNKQKFPGAGVRSPEAKKVKLQDQVKYAYMSEELEDDVDDESTIESPDASRHEVFRLQQAIAKVSISPSPTRDEASPKLDDEVPESKEPPSPDVEPKPQSPPEREQKPKEKNTATPNATTTTTTTQAGGGREKGEKVTPSKTPNGPPPDQGGDKSIASLFFGKNTKSPNTTPKGTPKGTPQTTPRGTPQTPTLPSPSGSHGKPTTTPSPQPQPQPTAKPKQKRLSFKDVIKHRLIKR